MTYDTHHLRSLHSAGDVGAAGRGHRGAAGLVRRGRTPPLAGATVVDRRGADGRWPPPCRW